MLTTLAKLSSISCTAAAAATHPQPSTDTYELRSIARPAVPCAWACVDGMDGISSPKFASHDSSMPWWCQPRTKPQSLHSTAPLIQTATSMDRLSSMDLYQVDSMPTFRSASASGRSSSGHIARPQLHVQRSSTHNRASMTSPVPGHIYTQPLSTDLKGLALKSFTCPVVSDNVFEGVCGGSGSQGLMRSSRYTPTSDMAPVYIPPKESRYTPTSDAAPVYVPPKELCPSGPLNAPCTPHRQLGAAVSLQRGVMLSLWLLMPAHCYHN
jgi:hypothetical protein